MPADYREDTFPKYSDDESYDVDRQPIRGPQCDVIPQAQAYCCGALHQHTGDLKTAKILRKRFLNSFNNKKLDYLISLATGCGAQIKRYPELESTELAHETANKLIDVNIFILQQIINNKNAINFLKSTSTPFASVVLGTGLVSFQQTPYDILVALNT